jgi:AcrR family transcriptional regulator
MVSTAPALEPRVDPRVTRTQKLVRDALKSLLAEKSFEAISVQDIAERATVNRATFYSHFTDKFALLDAIIRENVTALLAEGDPLSTADTRALLRGVATNVFAFVGSHRGCRIDRDFEPQFKSAIETALTEFLQPTFEHCTAMLVAAALVGSAMNWRHRAPKTDPAPIVAKIVDILIDGVDRHRG